MDGAGRVRSTPVFSRPGKGDGRRSSPRRTLRAFVFDLQDRTRCRSTFPMRDGGNIRIPQSADELRALRVNVKRTRAYHERCATGRSVVDRNGILFLSLSLSLSLSRPAGRLLAAATFLLDVWLSFRTARNGFVCPDEAERSERVRANYRASRNTIYPGNLYRNEHRYVSIKPRSSLPPYLRRSLSFPAPLSGMILVK